MLYITIKIIVFPLMILKQLFKTYFEIQLIQII